MSFIKKLLQRQKQKAKSNQDAPGAGSELTPSVSIRSAPARSRLEADTESAAPSSEEDAPARSRLEAGSETGPADAASKKEIPRGTLPYGHWFNRHMNPRRQLPPHLHAMALLDQLASDRKALPLALSTAQVRRAYSFLCLKKQWDPLPWQIVAAEFNRLIRQPGRPLKPYRYVNNRDFTRRQRVRVYFIDTNVIARAERCRDDT